MKSKILPYILICAGLLLSGCASYQPQGLAALRQNAKDSPGGHDFKFSPELSAKILALDPAHVTANDIQEVLSNAPAPHLINIHGGIYPVYLCMKSFSEFLIGLGYPEAGIRNPGNGSYSFSCYDSSDHIAGAAAWYYEHDGLRPMMVGHSQGGMQEVKVLHKLAGETYERTIRVWNPLTQSTESRGTITDPLTGKTRPVVGLEFSYATAVGAGGLTRILPNQWDVDGDLRDIPDSVEEFTGFSIGGDILGGDGLGYGPDNLYKATGKAVVRNLQLPMACSHVTIPNTLYLLNSQEAVDWINQYTPTNVPPATAQFNAAYPNILWAADVWYSIKKHWVLELQQLVRSKQANDNGH